ncbi:MAG: TIGR00300 family protein [Planctomycetota bacterium]
MKKSTRSSAKAAVSETVELHGHIIDSLTLPKVLDEIMAEGGEFGLEHVRIGHKRSDASYARVRITAPDQTTLDEILRDVKKHGAHLLSEEDAVLSPAPRDGVFPLGFYCTTNLETQVRIAGKWVPVRNIEMDCAIRVDPRRGTVGTVPMARVRRGDRVVVGHGGVRVTPLERDSNPDVFQFMGSQVSSEHPKGLVIRRIAGQIREARKRHQRVLVVGGPAIVHTGAHIHLAEIVRRGWVDVLFGGNALATHDIEHALYGTSLGVNLAAGVPTEEGHENHLRAINEIRLAGGIRAAIKKGILKRGLMHACFTRGVDVVLAGSIRDDGPLPEVITDVLDAQDAMRMALKNVGVALMIATTLHAIATGNVLPASVRTVCVDMNPAVVTKLADRGSFQAVGLVTDAEGFLRELARHLG